MSSLEQISKRQKNASQQRAQEKSPTESSASESTFQTWKAHLNLQLSHSSRGTRLSRSVHRGPLYVQKPFYPEGPECAHIYLLHPPGGLVSGDELTISLSLEHEAKALVTTPGAAKMYRARETFPEQRQKTRLKVAENASLEWFPMESIVYDGAHALMDTRVDLSSGSFFCGWEIMCLGLPASDQAFDSGRFQQSYRVFVDGVPRFIDRLQIDESKRGFRAASAGLQGQAVNGFLLAGPLAWRSGAEPERREFQVNRAEITSLLEDLRARVSVEGLEGRIAITVVNDFLLARYLGPSTQESRITFIHLWEIIRPALLGLKARAPGIWNT